jgi:hypothetical protein
MLVIYKPNGYLKGEILKTIPNDDYFEHISAGELLADHPEYDEQGGWHFTISQHEIRISTGSKEKEECIARLPGFDVGRFKKYWYLAYCKHHGYDHTITHANGEVDLIPATSPHNQECSQ